MARRVKDQTLDSKEARRGLKARGKPYYRAIERGLHLGYRKLRKRSHAETAGTWVARHYVGEQSYEVRKIGIADDLSDADGVLVLDFWQAQAKARKHMVGRAHAAAGKTGPYTVADAMDAYFGWLESEGRPKEAIADARYRDSAFIRPKLGETGANSLTAKGLRHWRDGLVKLAPRLRTKPGEKQQHREIVDDEETRRKRRASANRTWTVLRAALNRAFKDDEIGSDKEWRKVTPFKGVNAARLRYLELAEAKRLINGSDPEFRQLVRAALLTGGRYGQIARLIVDDFNSDAGTVRMRTRKGDGTEKVYHVRLTEEGVEFFRQACAGRRRNDLIFKKDDGGAWNKSEQKRPMAQACERAKIKPPIGFHGLRHTWASHAVMNGVPLLVVAKNLGHTDTRMVEQHYGHLAPSYIADAIMAGAPRFGFKPDTKVAALTRR